MTILNLSETSVNLEKYMLHKKESYNNLIGIDMSFQRENQEVRLFKELDRDGSGTLEWWEFAPSMSVRILGKRSQVNLQSITVYLYTSMPLFILFIHLLNVPALIIIKRMFIFITSLTLQCLCYNTYVTILTLQCILAMLTLQCLHYNAYAAMRTLQCARCNAHVTMLTLHSYVAMLTLQCFRLR